MTVTIGIRELRNTLSKQIAAVRGGETIIVTDHGKPVAQITPTAAESAEAWFHQMVAAGRITPSKEPKRPASELPESGPPLKGDKTLLDILLEDRGR